jgi:hypothetical protein
MSMAVTIQNTVVEATRVSLVLADAPEAENASVWIDISAVLPPEHYGREMPLALAHLAALRIARDAITEEMMEIASLANKNETRFHPDDVPLV